jgi:hypothetical protein
LEKTLAVAHPQNQSLFQSLQQITQSQLELVAMVEQAVLKVPEVAMESTLPSTQ